MNGNNFQQKDLVIKKLCEIYRHVRILEFLNIPSDLSDELSRKVSIFKISLNGASKIILEYYVQDCISEIMNEYNEEKFQKYSDLIGRVLK